jgi:fatty-acyl-CoA synthase
LFRETKETEAGVQRAGHPQDNAFEIGLERSAANYAPLTPLSFLERTAKAFPDRTAWIYGTESVSYARFQERCRRLASALVKHGVQPGDTVAAILPNTPPMLEAHYGIPMVGAVLNSINTRLEAQTIAYILKHADAKILLTDSAFAPTVRQALSAVGKAVPVIDVIDSADPGERLGAITYDDLLADGDPTFEPLYPADEWQAIGLNYTSGTTGHPKGVVVHHRGAHLNAVGQALACEMPMHPVYLWTLPMFHCNGWTFTWGVTLQAGTHVCLRRVEPGPIYDALADHGVTHMCGAPIVMNMIANAPDGARRSFPQRVRAMTGGAAPPAAVLTRMADIGIDMLHLYGLTECYGPASVCAWQEDWSILTADEIAAKQARQGISYPTLEGLDVFNTETMSPVPRNGAAIGEIVLRGNTVMKGYLKNPEATREAFKGGWYHTGDLAVIHEDGYAEVKDRSKDIIISGGENISSIEIEGALYRHPAVLEAAVVARPDEKWGESPCAFVTLKDGESVTPEDLIAHCRTLLAGFKIPRTILFGPLPKTSTGKIQKHILRDKAKELP